MDLDGRLALLVDQLVDYGICLLEPDGTIASWNAGAVRATGWPPGEVLGRHVVLLCVDEDRAKLERLLELALADGVASDEGPRRRRDGSSFWSLLIVTVVRDPAGELLGFGVVLHDLTHRRDLEVELRASAEDLREANAELEQFRRLVAGVRDYAIFLLDPDGHVATWNDGARRIKGYEAADIVGRSFEAFYTEEDRAAGKPAAALATAAREGRYQDQRWRLRSDGTRFWADVLITAVHDDHGGLAGYSKITRDLSAQHESEQALRTSQQRLQQSNAELERFAAVAAHDLKEPLRTVAGFADVLRRRYVGDLPHDARGFLDAIVGATERMQRLIGDVLDFARAAQAPAPAAPVDVRGAAELVLGDLRGVIGETDAQVVVDVPVGAVHVLVEPTELEMVLRNLIANAVRYAAGERPTVILSAERLGGRWRVTVADNGPGVPAEERARIFEAFRRGSGSTADGGSGLGLAICRRILERSGGAIGVDAAPGGGSRFWFSLPAA